MPASTVESTLLDAGEEKTATSIPSVISNAAEATSARNYLIT